jgi:hypothetical protein
VCLCVCVCVCMCVWCVCVCVQTVAGALGSMGPVLALVAFVVLLFGVGGIYIFGKGHVASMLHSAPHPHFHTRLFLVTDTSHAKDESASTRPY